MNKRTRRSFTDEFKVQRYQSGKSRAEIVREYDLSATVLDHWIKQSQTSSSFKE